MSKKKFQLTNKSSKIHQRSGGNTRNKSKSRVFTPKNVGLVALASITVGFIGYNISQKKHKEVRQMLRANGWRDEQIAQAEELMDMPEGKAKEEGKAELRINCWTWGCH